MTLQIDSLAINTDEAHTDAAAQIDQLHEQVASIDADILSAIERRTEMVRKLAAATSDATTMNQSTTFEALGSDGSAFTRMLARIASATR